MLNSGGECVCEFRSEWKWKKEKKKTKWESTGRRHVDVAGTEIDTEARGDQTRPERYLFSPGPWPSPSRCRCWPRWWWPFSHPTSPHMTSGYSTHSWAATHTHTTITGERERERESWILLHFPFKYGKDKFPVTAAFTVRSLFSLFTRMTSGMLWSFGGFFTMVKTFGKKKKSIMTWSSTPWGYICYLSVMVVSWLPVFIFPIKLTVTFTAAQFSCLLHFTNNPQGNRNGLDRHTSTHFIHRFCCQIWGVAGCDPPLNTPYIPCYYQSQQPNLCRLCVCFHVLPAGHSPPPNSQISPPQETQGSATFFFAFVFLAKHWLHLVRSCQQLVHHWGVLLFFSCLSCLLHPAALCHHNIPGWANQERADA